MLVVAVVLGLSGLVTALAATTPSLGTASSYGVLGSTYTNGSATTINGDVGFTTGPSVAPLGTHTNYGSGAPYSAAGTDQATALANLNSQACTFTFAAGAIDLAADTTHGAIGVYAPGVYCVSGAASIGTAGIALNGAGTYIFRVNGALTTVANSVVTLPGSASSCDVFWTPTSATTLGANSTLRGTIIDPSGITIGSTTLLTGRALAFGGTVTTDTDTISVPACTTPTATPTPTPSATPTPTPSVTPTPTATPSVTPTPSSTPTPTPTPSATPTPTPTPTPVPGLPSTGIGPDDSGAPWNVIIPAGIFVALLSLYLARKKLTV